MRNILIAMVIAIILPAPIGPGFVAGLIVFAVLARNLRDGVIVSVVGIACNALLHEMASGALPDSDEVVRTVLSLQFGVFCLLALFGLVFAHAVRQTGSTTLVVQISILLALFVAGAMIWSEVPLYEWLKPVVDRWQQELAAGGQQVQLASLGAYLDAAVALVLVFSVWLSLMVAGFIGYSLYGSLAGVNFKLGRFRDLSFGRLIAGALAAFCIAATLTKSPLIAALAVFLLLTFVVNGLALAHWVIAQRGLMPGLLVLVYVSLMLPVFNAVSVLGFAVLGYFDAWFDLRKHIPAASA